MSTLSKYSKKSVASVRKHEDSVVENFMGGNSYKASPITTLRIVAASAIFGEPQYYRDGIHAPKTIRNAATLYEYSIFNSLVKDKATAADVFTAAIDAALNTDFKATLDLAVELRKEYYMRLNPAVIFVRATEHPNRVAFNEANPGYMKAVGKTIALRPDDVTNQFDYYMFLNKSKNGMPSILKRTWAYALESFSRYQLNKYKGKSLIDLIRISHANSEDINELMRTGTLTMADEDRTWEQLKSEGKSWKEILETIDMPHMALLRNLRGIFTEISDREAAKEILAKLKAGVLRGKQFPFRYYSAYRAVKSEGKVNHSQMILDALEECLDISVANMPKLKGRVACLSDNSGSAWGTMNSEYGSVTIAEIANLSSLITALQSDEGEVGVFGDRLSLQSVSKRNGLLTQLTETSYRGKAQGGGTENGIWLFWDKAIREKIHYDTVFIYSDMQAGHGNLYGNSASQYRDFIHKRGGSYIDVLALVEKYRQTVNSKVNVFTVQVAGYDNSVLPENLYRGAILGGWTGKEPVFAKAVIDAWDQAEGIKQ
jgi:hypothetical protein